MADDNSSILAALQGIDPAEAMPFGAGATPQGSPTMLSGMLSGVMDIPKHLIDSAKNFNPNDIHQGVEGMVAPAADTAMALAGAGAPAAEAGAAGIFGGQLAKTANLRNLDRAGFMDAQSVDRSLIRKQTGWAKDPADGQWKFEIPDNNSRILTHGELNYNDVGDFMGGSAAHLFPHPELYKAYPDLRDVKFYNTVETRPAGEFTNYKDRPNSGPTISVEAPSLKAARSVGLHEMQHGVQDIEGFAKGANVPFYAGEIEKVLRKNGTLNAYDFQAIDKAARDAYYRTAGEVEARNVQTRQDYGPIQRLIEHPWVSQSVPYEDQLFLDHNTRQIIKVLKGQ